MDSPTMDRLATSVPSRFRFSPFRIGILWVWVGLACGLSGCGRSGQPGEQAGADQSSAVAKVSEPEPAAATGPAAKPVPAEPQVYELSAEQLLSARLTPEEASDGWIRLFDGHSLFGWQIAGAANFRVEDGNIVADGGDVCLLCTSIAWQDYELLVEFKAQEETNSGVFLRTLLDPQDVEMDCYEVNIAPDDNPFPTASIVGRKKVEPSGAPQPFDVWRTMTMRLEGDQLRVSLDGEPVCDYTDPVGLATGRIGLQHNSGRIEFRKVILRPLGLESLLDEELSQWKQYPEMDARFTVNDEGYLRVQGGSGQLETRAQYGDFVLLAEYKLAMPETNSGIFFRCIPGDKMMGYECQVSNQMENGNPLKPADCGTGGIFRRQDARVVAGEADRWATVLLTAQGASMAAWVNGIQVSDWTDTREPDENPRRGLRTDPGTIMIQGHDPQTDGLFKQFRVRSLDQPGELEEPRE